MTSASVSAGNLPPAIDTTPADTWVVLETSYLLPQAEILNPKHYLGGPTASSSIHGASEGTHTWRNSHMSIAADLQTGRKIDRV